MFIAFAARSPAQAQQCVEAVRARLEPGRISAEGHVRLRLPGCTVGATELTVTRDGLAGKQVTLTAGGLHLSAHRLSLGPRGLEASFVHGWPCACPGGGEPLVTFSARTARVAAGASRLHLRWPSLWIGQRRVLTLPYALLPLEPGVSGLLPPEVGYSGRDGLRLVQGVYLAPSRRMDLLLHGGWVQRRGAHARARLRWWDPLGDGNLALSGLHDQERWRGEIRGVAAIGGPRWSVGVAPDMVSDLDYAAHMSQDPGRVFAPHLRSRAWVWAGLGPGFVATWGDMIQNLSAPVVNDVSTGGQVTVLAGILPTALVGPVFMDLTLAVTRQEPGRDQGVAAVVLDAALSWATTLGPLRFSSRGAYGLLARFWDDAGDEVIHRGTISVETSLPLARIYGDTDRRLRHTVEPFAGAHWSGGTAGRLREPDGSTPRDGGFAVAGLRNTVVSRRQREALRVLLQAEVNLLWPLPGLVDGADAQPHLGGTVRLRAGPVRGAASLSWALEDNRLAEVQARICARAPLGLRPCAGYTRLRLEQLHGLAAARVGAWLLAAHRVMALQTSADQVWGSLGGRWGPVAVGLTLAADPVAGRLTHGSGRVDLSLGCGCYRVGLQGHGRVGQDWPDVLAHLEYTGSGRGGCGL